MIIKKIGSIIISITIVATMFGLASEGVKVEAIDTVLSISTQSDLVAMTAAGSYKLSNNISLTGNWTPIPSFTGTLDGNGFVISNLTVATDVAAPIVNGGLFATANGATIKNLGINNASVTADTLAGVFVGSSTNVKLNNCYAVNSTVSPDITGKELLGNAITPNNCYFNSGSISTLNQNKNDTYINWIGSDPTPTLQVFKSTLIGNGTVDTPYSITSADDLANMASLINNGVGNFSTSKYKLTTNISGASITPIGNDAYPFKGEFDGNGNVISGTVSNGEAFAGLFGETDTATIKNLGIAIGVTGTTNVGGLIGLAKSTTVSKCYSTGAISGTGSVGGLIGTTSGTTAVTNSYVKGTVSGGTTLGGVVGTSGGGTFTNCYTTSNKFFGAGTAPTFTNCYYTGTSTTATGLTTKTLAQMQSSGFSTLLNANATPLVFTQAAGSTPTLIEVGEGKAIGAPCKITITQAADGGTLKLLNGSTEVATGDYVPKNTTLTIQATPKSGYDLTAVKVGETSITATSFVVTGDVTVEPVFTKYEGFTIKVSKNEGGTVTPADSDVVVRKGGLTQTFTIVPDIGYKIESVKYSGGGLTVNGNQYVTSQVTRNETLTIKFVSKIAGVTDVTSTSDGVVVTVKALENVIDVIPDNEGNIIKVKMDKNTVIDDKTLAALKGKNIRLVLDMGTYTWTINGKDITAATLTSINLGVIMGTGTKVIDPKLLTSLDKYTDKMQLDLVYSGPFPFDATLTLKAPGNSPGNYANLFYFNEKSQKLETSDSCVIAPDGSATFKFKHASSYFVVVADKALSLQDLSLGAWIREITQPIAEMDTSQLTIATILLLVVIAGGITLTVIVRKNH